MAKKKVDLQGVPDGAELVKVEGQGYHLFYPVDIPGKKVPVRMGWRIDSNEELIRIFGSKKKAENNVKRTITMRQYKSLGIFNAGTSEALADLGNNPWVQFREEYVKNRKLRPWLGNAEMLQIALEAYAEGRQPTEAELKNTQWYRKSNDAQRAWLEKVNSNPGQAELELSDNRVKVNRWIAEAGISNLNTRAINYLTNRLTHGDWSEDMTKSQIMNLADYHAPGGLNKPLSRLAGGAKIRAHDNENKVRGLVKTHLGPAIGQWSYDQIKNWASRLRTDPNGEEALTNMLRRQFRAAWGDTYTDPDLTYEDIATPWRNFGNTILGETVDETSDAFIKTLKANDAVEARKLLVNYGLSRGIKKVENDIFASMREGLGSSVVSIGEAQ